MVLEATGNALAIARILEPHVAEVVLAHAKQVRAISHARIKTDKVDAKVLADLLAADLIPAVWIGDERCRMLRRLVSRRRGLVKRRTQIKNEISAVLHRNLKGRNPASDPFGKKGREWIAEQQLPVDERLTVDGGLRQLDFLGDELAADRPRSSPSRSLGDEDVRRLMTIPGIDVVTAEHAGRGDRRRPALPDARATWSAISGCTRRSASRATARPATAALSKEGSAAARHVLVEAAWSAAKSPGPLRAFAQRTAARRGRHVATVAVARKLAVLAWHLLTRGEDYAFARPSLVAPQAPRARARAPARRAPSPGPKRRPGLEHRQRRRREAPRRSRPRSPIAAWSPTGRPAAPKVGAGATPERASQRPSKGKAARQATSS